MRVAAFGCTDVGRVRRNNEDSFWLDAELGLFLVADGMGGHAAGEVASQLAVHEAARFVADCREELALLRAGHPDRSLLEDIARRAVEVADVEVRRVAAERADCAGMGCTLSLLVVAGRLAAMGHVGDSRIYQLRRGTVSQLSQDHTIAFELVRSGLSAESARLHPQAHALSRTLGGDVRPEVQTLVLELEAGDRFLLCSDGLSLYLPGGDWLAEHLSGAELEAIPEELVAHANRSGGRDNITSLVVEVGGPGHARGDEANERFPAALPLSAGNAADTA